MLEEPRELDAAVLSRQTVSLPYGSPGQATGNIEPETGAPALSRRARKAARRAEKHQKPRRLTRDELRDRLCLNSNGLVEEIHSFALRQNLAEDQRESRLDAKAQGLLATAGLSLTVAFGFGGILLQHPDYLTPLGVWPGRAVLLLYALALLFGLLASLWAVRALLVRDAYKRVTDDDVFNVTQLDTIEHEAGTDDKKAQTLYRRFMTLQQWMFWRLHSDIHDNKADLIKIGQCLFVAFVCILLLIGIAITCSAFSRYESPGTQSQIQQRCTP